MKRLGLALIVVTIACGGGGGSSSSWPSASEISNQSFTGALGDGSVLTVEVGTAASVRAGGAAADSVAAATTLTATGTVAYSGGSAALTGTYDPSTGALSLSGGGYTIDGTYAEGAIVGTVTTPSAATYDFVVAIGDATAVTVYCGSYTTAVDETGAFTMMIAGSHAWGVTFSGSVSGTSISMTVAKNGTPISGTIGGDGAVSGTFRNSDGTGTWEGSSSACP